jgi:LysM repeat protein
MNAGTKVFLAVVALLVGVMILYYGVFQTGDHPTTAKGSTPEAPAVRTPPPSNTEIGHLTQPVLRNEPKPAITNPGGAPNVIPQANDPLADLGSPTSNSTRNLLTDAVTGPSTNTPLSLHPQGSASGTGAPSNTPTRTPTTLTPPEIKSNTATPKPGEVQPTNRNGTMSNTGNSARTNEGVEYTSYTVKAGDTGVSIAKEWFGDGNKWALISKANPMVDFNRLKIGQKLRLPPKSAATEPAKPASTTTSTTTGKPTEAVATDPNTYTVKSGDTLNSIARAKYGDANLWELIYDANKKTIGDDASALKVGMKLTIPAKPAKAATGSSH